MKNRNLQGGKKTRLFFLLFLLMGSLWGQSQVTITGKVTDANGDAVPGATVAIKNSIFATASDAEGNFSLATTLNPGSILIMASSVGLKSETRKITATSGNNIVNFSLKVDILGLDEVVVTGTSAGTTRKQLGSFVSTVKADDINKGVAGNALQALQGKTAGAQITQNSGDPAGGMSVRLRGISTVNSSSEPLYIVDGIIVNNATNRVTNTQNGYDGGNFVGTVGQNRMVDINPADIERIEVLNGAAAAAIYGSRANSGVIQIFTKRGTSGKPIINFSSTFMSSSLRKQVPVNMAPTKFGGPPDGPGAFTQDILSAVTTTTPVTRFNYWDYIFRNAAGTDNNISIRGGNENTKYFASGSYFYNQGIIKNTDFTRYSFRINLDQKINNILSANIGLNYVSSGGNEKPDGNSFFSPMNSVTILGNIHNIQARDGNGNLLAVGERGRINPVSVIEDFKQRQETSRVLANIGFKLKPMKGLTIDYTLGMDSYSQNGSTFIPPYAYNASPGFWGGGPSLDATQNGYASAATNNFFQVNHELNGTYSFDINKDISSTTQVGYQLQYEKNKYILSQGRGLSPAIETVNGASTILPGVDSRSELSISGAYLQQNFKIKNQFFVTGAIRQDQSSVFGPNQRNQIYLKASGSWVLSESNWWQEKSVSKWWDLAKVRVAYGQSGNLTGIGAYERFNVYTSNAYLGRTALQSLTRQANLEVKPERQNEIEFGTDLAFLKNRVTLTVNYYVKKVSDLLINRNVAPTTGFTTLLDNFGSIENRGIEVVLGGTPIQNKDFTWEITGIFNRNRNEAVRIGQALTLFSTNGGAPVAIIEGQPIGIFYGTFFAADASGNQIKNSNGIPVIERGTQNSATSITPSRGSNGLPIPTDGVLRRIIGDPNPDYTATLINSFTYKKFSLRVQLDAVQGVDVFNADFRTRQGVGNGNIADQEHRGLLPRGYILGIYPIEEWRIDDGSFVKLRELSFSYDFGKVGKVFNNLSLNFSGRNLISWDNYKGFDPEVNAGGQSTLLRGIDFGAVPIPRTFSFGVNAKF
jgi:TonB-linked SusC/RagA family outer membrane protein